MGWTRTELIAVIGLIFCVGTPLAHASSLEDGLIAWWRMELKVGSTIPDASGNGHDLTVNGSPTFEDNIVIFNDDGNLVADDSDALDLMGDWSVSYWAREDSNDHSPNSNPTNGWMSKVRSFHDVEGGWFLNSSAPAGINATFYGSPNCNSSTDEGLVIGSWYRITTTYETAPNRLRIYLNDVLEIVVEGTCGLLANTYPVVLGGDQLIDESIRPYCKGAMADVRIYDRTLSDSEVGELFAMGSPEDSDGDGVPNEDDDCPDSDLGPSIVIDECDTGVENEMLDDGCTMADLIMQCADDAVNHGAFVRCVSHLANLWKCQGLTNGQQKGAIMSCAGEANLP